MGPRLTMQCKRDEHGTIVSAMPPTVEKLFSYGDRVLGDLKRDQEENGNDLLADSYLLNYSVCTVPVLPLILRDDQENSMIKLNLRAQSCDHMLPVKLVDSNIAANEEVQKQLKEFYDEWLRPAVNKGRYFSLHCDCAIFWPIMKVRCIA